MNAIAADLPSWGFDILRLIARKPGVLAATLAAEFGLDTPRFKRRVRQLKELGLTESLEIGYRLSLRGHALVEWGQSFG